MTGLDMPAARQVVEGVGEKRERASGYGEGKIFFREVRLV